MYLETVDWATTNPSISNSPWIRGAPQSGFSLLIRPMRSRSSRSTFGRPALLRDFQRQNALKPEPNIGPDDAMILAHAANLDGFEFSEGTPAVLPRSLRLDESRAVLVFKPEHRTALWKLAELILRTRKRGRSTAAG